MSGVYQVSGFKRSYATTFTLTENPISQAGQWISAKGITVDWADVRTTPGKVFGTQTGNGNDGLNSPPNKYDDSLAFLAGPWRSDYVIEATIYNDEIVGNWNSEVELLGRGAMSSHVASFYECNVRTKKESGGSVIYGEIVRLNGAIGDFTYLDHQDNIVPPTPGIVTGDRLKATFIGPAIKLYLNDVLVAQASDSTFPAGLPGVGFYLNNQGSTGDPVRSGFSSYSVREL